VKQERQEGILILTLQDPPTRNAMGQEMADELMEALDQYDRNPGDRVLVLTGGDPSFCSGANVRGMGQRIRQRESGTEDADSPLPWGRMEARLRKTKGQDMGQPARVPLRLSELQKPSLAAVNGHAVGLGLGLAISCDIRIASENASFSEAFVRMGLIPGDGSCWQLPRLIGLSNTFLLQYTGDSISATEAHRMGMVSKVVPHVDLMKATMELAARLANGPTQSMSIIKYLIQKSQQTDMREGLELAHAAQELARQTEDHKEAVQAFLEKRKPHFQGR
jgi:2-(1,2-epoxy-1,2-dihydrophenyl)acetyl-CoA isomerase